MKLFPLIALSAFVISTQSHADLGPRIPRTSFLCAELLASADGEIITSNNVTDEFAIARARLASLVDAPTTGRWAKFLSWFDTYNPYVYGGFKLHVDHLVDPNATVAPSAASTTGDDAEIPKPPTVDQRQMATAALERLDTLEKAVLSKYGPAVEVAAPVAASAITDNDGRRQIVDILNARSAQLKSSADAAAPIDPTAERIKRADQTSASRLLVNRVIKGRPAIYQALVDLRDGIGAREAAHPGVNEIPARVYTPEKAARLRVGRFTGDLLRTLFHGTGSLVAAAGSIALTNALNHAPSHSVGQVAAVVGLAAVSAVQMGWFVDSARYLKTSFRTFSAGVAIERENAIRRDHEENVTRGTSPLRQIDFMIEMLLKPARYHKAVVMQSLKVTLPINAPDWNGARLPITAAMIERFERVPSPRDFSINRSLQVDLLFVYDDEGVPTLKFFVNEVEVDSVRATAIMSGDFHATVPF